MTAVPAVPTLPPAPRDPALTRVPWGAVVLFVALAIGLAWLVSLPLWLMDRSHPENLGLGAQLVAQLIPTAMMFTPALAMLVVVFFANTPRSGRARFLGLWPMRPAKRVVWFIVLGNFLPAVLVALALGIAILCGWYTPDFVGFSGFAQALPDAASAQVDVRVLVLVQLALIPLAGLLNMLPAFGEEVGWRGWLLPALRPLGTWPALMLSGIIWGVWHAPVTLLGHNFGLYDLRGVALMTVGCVVWGTLFGWLRLRSGSVWPAVIAHGALNGVAQLFVLFAAAGAPLRLPLVNPLGVSGGIVGAIAIVVLLGARQFGSEPQLARTRELQRY